jgi:hypothetical protein
MQRECEFLALSRDTTETDIKQRREVHDKSVTYIDQCAVTAAIHGRVLILEGLEKCERNVMPVSPLPPAYSWKCALLHCFELTGPLWPPPCLSFSLMACF